MRFLLRATADLADAWYGYAWVEIDPAQVQALMSLKEAFQAAYTSGHKASGQSLYEMWFWDHGTTGTARFYENLELEDFLTEEEITVFERRDLLVVPDERQLGDTFEEKDPERTDCDQVVITDDSVSFFAYPKHGDFSVRTSSITFEALLPLLEEKK
jgi:hypothetical protein